MEQSLKQLNPNHPFQRFANENFFDSNNQKVLNALQNDYGLNANILLFCCWAAQTGRGRLTKKQLHQIIAAAYPWHENVVLGLKEMSQSVTKESPKHIKELIDTIQTEEKTALEIEQLMIAESLPELIAKPRAIKQQVTHAIKSIATYNHELRVHFDGHDCNKISKLLASIFPKTQQTSILSQCQKTLMNKRIQTGMRKQTRLF